MEKKNLEILAGLALLIILSGLTGAHALGYFDSDGDGVVDNQDAFPNDPLKSKDSDGDGIADIADAFPYDPDEQYDRDGDGIGNNADEFPNNPRESKDSDGDGLGDNADAFPNDPNKWRDPSALPTEIVLDRDIQLSEISNGKGITYDGTYYYILNYNYEDNQTRRVHQFNSDFSFTGVVWNYTDYVENPTGIAYYDGHIYIIGNKYIEGGYRAYIFKFSIAGEYKNSTNISSYVDYARAITCSDDHMYICDSKSTKESIHIYNASTLSHAGVINISHYPSDIIVHETGNWYYINDQSLGVYRLYLYDLDGNYQNWSKQFYQKNIELVEDTLIALDFRNKIYIYKLF